MLGGIVAREQRLLSAYSFRERKAPRMEMRREEMDFLVW
jgi:hypothetical protein